MAKQTISTADRRAACFKCLADCRAKGAADKDRKDNEKRERAARDEAATPTTTPA
jgi:hypothetical protein